MRKRGVVALIAMLSLLGVNAWGAAELTPRPNLIHVTGHALVKVVPDTGKVQFQIRVDGQDMNQAAQEAARTMQGLMDQIKALNLEGANVDATGLSLTASYPQPRQPQPGGPAGAAGAAPPGPVQPTGYSATFTATSRRYGGAWSGYRR